MNKSIINSNLIGTMGKSIFLERFGDYPINRILDFLVVFDNFDYSLADIAKNAGVGYSTIKLLINDLVKHKLLIQTRISGRNKMYKLNKENQIISKFISFYWDITNKSISKPIIEKVYA